MWPISNVTVALPLFYAAKFGWRPLLECRTVMLPRREIHWNYLGCPKLTNRSQPLECQSSPYCKDGWGDIAASFYIVDTHLIAKIYRPTKLCNGAQMANFWRFFVCCIFSEPHAACFRPACQICSKATPCVEVCGSIQSAMAEIRRGKKEEEEERKK